MNIKSAVIVAGGIGLVALATLTAPASHAASTSPSVTAKAKTCAAVTTWSRHRTDANLDAAMTDSFKVPWQWLGAGVNQLYMDVRGGAVKWIKPDLAEIRQDCK